MKPRLVMGLVMMAAWPAMGQILGLPVGGGAAVPAAGAWPLSGGGVFNGEVNLYGGRVAAVPVDGLVVFADAGVIDMEGMDAGLGVQGGTLYRLPFRWPVEVALRATAGWGATDSDQGNEMELTTFNGGMLISKLYQNFFTPYGFIGANYLDSEVSPAGGAAEIREDMTELMLTGGVAATPGEALTVYLEASYLDTTEWIEDVFFAAGARWVY